MFLLFFSLTLT